LLIRLRDRYTRHEVTASRVGSPSGRTHALDPAVESAFGGEREHEAREAAEDHADADERTDDPDRAGRPRAPDHDGQNEGDDAVDQQPVRAVARPQLERLNDLNDSFKEEIDGEDQGEGDERAEWVHEQVDAGDEVDGPDDQLPDHAAGGVGLEGEDEVSDAAENHRPGEDERDGKPGERWDEDGKEAGKDQQDAEGDRPVDSPGGESGEGGGCGAHLVAPPEGVDTGLADGRRIP
jgi:hypothetical protein